MAERLRLQESDGFLIRGSEVRAREDEMGRDLALRHFGEHVTIVPVLEGGRIFGADLSGAAIRAGGLTSVTIASVDAKSYKGTQSTGTVNVSALPDARHITSQNVVIAEDIGDSYRTLSRVCDALLGMDPASLEICALLDRPGLPKAAMLPDDVDLFVGFSIADDAFALGNGLDVDGKYRGLSFVTVGVEVDGVVEPLYKVEPPLDQLVVAGTHS